MTVELADTSVWTRQRNRQIGPWFNSAILAGEIAICDMVALEILIYESPARYRARADSLAELPWIGMNHQDWERTREVQAMLAARGRQTHRSVKIADLLIAAAAGRAGLTLVHYDQDFDLIAEVTGQATRWMVPRGSLGS